MVEIRRWVECAERKGKIWSDSVTCYLSLGEEKGRQCCNEVIRTGLLDVYGDEVGNELGVLSWKEKYLITYLLLSK